jgi:hypothetical protein
VAAFPLQVHELREGTRISVAAASKILGNILYQVHEHTEKHVFSIVRDKRCFSLVLTCFSLFVFLFLPF